MSEHADYHRVCNISVCAELDDNEAKLLAAKMGVRHLKDGEMLVKEGTADQSLFVLVSGKLAVYSADANGKESLVYNMKEGECAGTRAFVDRTPRKATLRAVGNTMVYTLTPKDFESLLDPHPRLVYKVMRALFRVTHTNLMRMNQETQQLSNYINKTQGRY
jgi:CRP/FNR family transcriptional regulator, cyclic AMP receptor protein